MTVKILGRLFYLAPKPRREHVHSRNPDVFLWHWFPPRPWFWVQLLVQSQLQYSCITEIPEKSHHGQNLLTCCNPPNHAVNSWSPSKTGYLLAIYWLFMDGRPLAHKELMKPLLRDETLVPTAEMAQRTTAKFCVLAEIAILCRLTECQNPQIQIVK